MKDNLKIVSMINLILEEAEEQVRRRQMEEKLEESTKELTKLQTDSINTAKPDFN